MDWSKTKNILIIALIATNIFLLVTYMAKNEKESSMADTDVLMTILEERNVFVNTTMPDYQEKLPAITLTYSDEKEKIAETLTENEYMVGKGNKGKTEAYRDIAEKFLKDCDIYSENIRFAQLIKEDKLTTVRFENLFKDIVISGRYIDVIFENGKIVDVSNQFVTVASKSKKKMEIISPGEALMILMSEKEKDTVLNVEKLELVFWINDTSFEGTGLISDTAFPAWKVTCKEGNDSYIKAYRE